MKPLVKNPRLYEINTRIWLREFDTPEHRATLEDVPESYWDDIKSYGIDVVWLMGVWKTNPSIVERYDFRDDLLAHYDRTLPGWTKEDVIGSPYAIDSYVMNASVGSAEALAAVRTALHKRGMRLMLDFVPNHFSADSSLIDTHPDVFLQGNLTDLQEDDSTFYRAGTAAKVFAHGRDPYFPAWPDTIQVNYFNPTARKFMTDILVELADICDGVRCDMGMLMINDIFRQTWASQLGGADMETEFWPVAIAAVKHRAPDFIFMAEAYWEREWELQNQGFDYTYDKSLTDRLHAGQTASVREHLLAEADYQHHSVRFLENHDEDPAIAEFGKQRSLAAAVVITTIQGMRFYNHGQFQGKTVRPPVQMGRALQEPVQQDVLAFYQALLYVTHEDVFIEGEWQQHWPQPAWDDNASHDNFLIWEWQLGEKRRLVVVNYSDHTAQCRIHLNVDANIENIELHDLVNNISYPRQVEEIIQQGLFIELDGYQSHVFAF